MFPIKDDPVSTNLLLETFTPSKKDQTEEEKIDKMALRLFTDAMGELDKRDLLFEIRSLPRAEIADVINQAVPLLTNAMNAMSRWHLLHGIHSISQAERANVINHARPLFTDAMRGLDMWSLLLVIRNIPQDQRADVINHALPLFWVAMTGVDKENLLEEICALPPDQRADIINLAMPLFRVAMNGLDKRLLLKIIYAIPQAERADVISLAILFSTNAMSGFNMRQLLGKILEIPQNQRADFKNLGIRDIPQDQRVDVCYLAKPLFTNTMKRVDKKNLLSAICNISQDQRADVINHAKSLFTATMSVSDKETLLQGIEDIPQDQRADVINHAKPLFTATMSVLDKMILFPAICDIPQDQRADIINHAKPLFTDTMSKWDEETLLQRIRDIPQDQRADVINHALPLFSTEVHAQNKGPLLRLVRLISPSERADIVQTIKSLSHKNGDFFYATLANTDFIRYISKENLGEFIRRIIRDLSEIGNISDLTAKTYIGKNKTLFFYLLMEYLNIKELLSYDTQHFLENPQYRTGIIASLEHEFTANNANPEMLLELARFVDSYKDTMWLHEEHTLVQHTIEILSIEEAENEKSPFTLYRTLKNLSSCPSTFNPPLGTVAGVTISFCLKQLQSYAAAFRISRNELPRKATYEAWQSLINELKTKVEVNEKAHRQLETYGTSWDEIWNGCFSDTYLKTLLRYSNEHVSIVEAQFRAILHHILAQENTPKEGQIFSAQDEVLIKTAMNIKSCVGGKNEAIAKIYQILAPEYRYRAKGFETGDDTKDAARAWIAEEIQKLFVDQCSGTNALMQELTEEPDAVKEPPHQAIYLKNIIGRDIGLHHEVLFDRHTGMLYDSLVAKTREEILEVFFRHMTPQVLVNELVKLTNNNPKVKRHMSAFIENAHEADQWELCDDGIKVKATELAIVTILRKLGYFTSH